ELVKVVEFNGEEYLFYPGFKVDVALLRGTIADEKGNISFAHESVINEGLAIAEATKNSGGIVIVQVEYLAKADTLNPKDVKIPGALVDYVVKAKDPMSCWQAEGDYWEPSFSGQIKIPLDEIKPIPFDERKVVCRRCAMELKAGDLINLGVGMPADVSKVVAEEGQLEKVTMSTESGMVGGVPSALPSFGSAYNPEAIITPNDMFDFISGGGLDMTCLGIGQVDKYGNNNVSRMGSRLTGPGGFIDITAATKKVIFAGTFTGHAEYKLGDGKIEVVKEGDIRKFVDTVSQITFAGQYSPEDQEVLYITERAVFKLIDKKMTIIEIAPGLDLQKDILDQMDFVPEIADDLKTMDPAIFCETWGGLKL
ncbi:MAG: malonate decarboxylase subunit alpha, partial [Clostridia bacterium]|nr:malonate decarboxylase subunit alpha [Clostridia bacterium]